MIAYQLAPIDLGFGITLEEACQACAFTYLAGYNAEVAQTRVTEAYKRAWAPDQILYFPRKVNGTPGFVVALWNNYTPKRMLIAIEGSTAASQVVTVSAVAGLTARDGWLGLIDSNFKAKADDIYTQVTTSVSLTEILADRRTIITWAGHSLGAACADICAVRQKYADANRHVRLIKFGAPAIGNDVYVNNYQRLLPRANYYCRNDPIHWFPHPAVQHAAALAAGPMFPAGLIANMAKEPTCMRIDWDSGDVSAGYRIDEPTFTRISYVRRIADALAPGNPWYDHLIGSYRMAFIAWASRQNDMAKYRMCYLEHNDEDTWQVEFPTTRYWLLMQRLSDPSPAPVNPPSGATEAQIVSMMAEAAAREEAGDDAGGGGEWGGVDVQEPAFSFNPAPLIGAFAGASADWGAQVPTSQARILRVRRPNPS